MNKTWHVIFLSLIVIVSLVIGIGEYRQSQKEVETKRDVSSGSLPRNELKENGIIVLCYHRILDPSKTLNVVKTFSNNNQIHEYSLTMTEFKQQLEYLKRHQVKFISTTKMTELVKAGKPLKHQYAVITFDDFDSTVYTNARPVLDKMKIPYTIFVVTGITGQYDQGTKLASWRQIKKMTDDSSLATIG